MTITVKYSQENIESIYLGKLLKMSKCPSLLSLSERRSTVLQCKTHLVTFVWVGSYWFENTNGISIRCSNLKKRIIYKLFIITIIIKEQFHH